MKNELILTPLSDLKPYENNPRNNTGAIEAVANSIREFGFKVPIIIDKNGVIVAGHTRYEAAKKLGLEHVPCIRAVDLTEEQITAFRLADNKTGELAKWDFEALEDELAKLREIDMSDFGFKAVEEAETAHTERKDLSDKVTSCYEVIVECADESEQERIYEKLISEGLSCRVLTL